jgi:hypothetical protein
LKTLRNCVIGSVACIAFGSASLIWRVPLLRGRGKEPGAIERALWALSVFVIVVGFVYAFFAVREFLALRAAHREEHRPRRQKKRQ